MNKPCADCLCKPNTASWHPGCVLALEAFQPNAPAMAKKRCEKCDAPSEPDNRVRGYEVPYHEMWGLCRAGERCWLCDMCADDAGLRE